MRTHGQVAHLCCGSPQVTRLLWPDQSHSTSHDKADPGFDEAPESLCPRSPEQTACSSTVNPDARLTAAKRDSCPAGKGRSASAWPVQMLCVSTRLRPHHGLLLLQGVVETGIAQVGDRAWRDVDCRAGRRSSRGGKQQALPQCWHRQAAGSRHPSTDLQLLPNGNAARQAAGTHTETETGLLNASTQNLQCPACEALLPRGAQHGAAVQLRAVGRRRLISKPQFPAAPTKLHAPISWPQRAALLTSDVAVSHLTLGGPRHAAQQPAA